MITISERLKMLADQYKETSAVYRPRFYHLNKAEDLKEFTQLLTLPGILVVDHIFEQITEFVKLKSPHRRFSAQELKQAAQQHVGDTAIDEYGVWVFYPWSNKLVHILDEKEFIEVRTSRNQYKITREERDALETKKIGVIGLSVGQSVSVTLAMERVCGELRLADFDLLELTNLNRIRTGVHNLGLAKVYSVAREISEIDPYIKVTCFPEGLNEANLHQFFTEGGNLDVLVEESDGFDIKILSRYKARELKIPVIMEASDRCMVDVERFDLEPERNILHGIVKHLDIDTLKKLKTNEEKIPYMLDILGLGSTTPRLRASMLEMQQTINTWPQLGSAVTMGGGITADVCRRVLLGQFTDSGRYYVDIDELIGDKKKKKRTFGAFRKLKAGKPGVDEIKTLISGYQDQEVSDISDADLENIVKAGAMAPSYGNKQPWIWASGRKKLFLFNNGDTLHSDINGHHALISIGTAIENVIIKSESLGYQVSHTLFPLSSQNNLAAVFSFIKNARNDRPAEHDLAPYIELRQTNRKAGNGAAIEKNSLDELTVLVDKDEEALLEFVTDQDKINAIANIVGIIERIRLLNPVFHADYFVNEIRWHSDRAIYEGLDVKTLELIPAAETAYEVISDPEVATLLQKWGKGSAFENMAQQVVASSAAIGLLSMPSNAVPCLIRSGRLAERIWLTATKNNLAFQPICVPLSFLKLLDQKNKNKALGDDFFSELNALRAQLKLIFSKLGSREAVFLFRVSQADKPLVRSLRKPLNEIYFKS